jgi:hypothetical protein
MSIFLDRPGGHNGTTRKTYGSQSKRPQDFLEAPEKKPALLISARSGLLASRRGIAPAARVEPLNMHKQVEIALADPVFDPKR